ncbi:fimbrillin family protein [Parabacteroides sp. PF5-9]|uniref:fimbrillin family protein n=1 Tax=Parabacteroides sp. PF5-9 TaxID=1742404 RepID=UPI0024751946|nr:fimbrillin family protein [Parabacteroides sp. PF5-9]MDH6359213.1 hypothetical protein [Parabacteroides sp. PF5-9]
MSYKNIFLGLVTVFLWTACAEEDHIGKDEFEAGKYPLLFSTAIDGYLQKPETKAPTSLNFGVRIVDVSLTPTITNYNNVEYRTEADDAFGSFVLSPVAPLVDQRYWVSESQEFKVTAYYPYYGSKGTWPTSQRVDLEADQSDQSDYDQNDHLYLEEQTVAYFSRSIPLLCEHLFSQIRIVLEADTDSGITEADIAGATVKIANTNLSATVNMDDGTVTPIASTEGDITPYSQYEEMYNQNVLRAIIIPQVLNAGTEFIVIKIGNQEYSYKIDSKKGESTNQEFESGMQYTYKVTVKQNSIEVTVQGSSSDWIEGWGTPTVIDGGSV